jgi:hypothetical protein
MRPIFEFTISATVSEWTGGAAAGAAARFGTTDARLSLARKWQLKTDVSRSRPRTWTAVSANNSH